MRKFDPNHVEAEEKSLYADRTVKGEYEQKKSIEALTGKAQQKRERRERMRALAAFYETQQAAERQMGEFYEQTENVRRGMQSIAKKGVARGVARGGLPIAGTICFWQCVFALISLIAFVLHATLVAWKEQSILGRFAGFFVDFEKYFPGEYIGYGFWGLALIVGLGGFIGFIIFFYCAGIKMVKSTLSLLILALCVAGTILPVLNLAPWLLFWVLYLNATTLSSKS